jgi:CHAD domain-containing protein
MRKLAWPRCNVPGERVDYSRSSKEFRCDPRTWALSYRRPLGRNRPTPHRQVLPVNDAREIIAPALTNTDPRDIPAPPNGDASPPDVASAPPRDEWIAVRQLAMRQLNRFMALEPKVLRGDNPDAIHDMRVASRRLQQILDLLYPKPRPRDLRALRRKIQRSRRCLSEVRNCDVLLAQTEKALASKRVSRRDTRVALRQYLSGRRAESFDKALSKLGRVNLAVFYLDLRCYLGPIEMGAPLSHQPHHPSPAVELTPALFYQRLGESLGRVWRAFESRLAFSRSDPRPPVIHSARIATKRLRYLIEVIAEFDVAGSEESLGWLRQLQRRLGEWHDLEVLEQMMIEMVARPDFLREQLEMAMGVEKLIARNRVLKRKLQERYFRMTLESPDLLRLKDWVGYLLSSPSAAFARA